MTFRRALFEVQRGNRLELPNTACVATGVRPDPPTLDVLSIPGACSDGFDGTRSVERQSCGLPANCAPCAVVSRRAQDAVEHRIGVTRREQGVGRRGPTGIDLVTTGAEHTREIGARLGRRLRRGDVVLLHGDLGAGKTTLAQGIARGLGVADTVQARPSPWSTSTRDRRPTTNRFGSTTSISTGCRVRRSWIASASTTTWRRPTA